MLEGQGELSRCPFHPKTQESWVLGANQGFGSSGHCGVGGLGSALVGDRVLGVLGRWLGVGVLEGGRGAVTGRGRVRQKSGIVT